MRARWRRQAWLSKRHSESRENVRLDSERGFRVKSLSTHTRIDRSRHRIARKAAIKARRRSLDSSHVCHRESFSASRAGPTEKAQVQHEVSDKSANKTPGHCSVIEERVHYERADDESQRDGPCHKPSPVVFGPGLRVFGVFQATFHDQFQTINLPPEQDKLSRIGTWSPSAFPPHRRSGCLRALPKRCSSRPLRRTRNQAAARGAIPAGGRR